MSRRRRSREDDVAPTPWYGAPIARQLELESSPASAAAARRFVEASLVEWGCAELADVAVLLVSEIVTNAVLYARSGIVVHVARIGDGVRVEVADDNPVLPAPRRYDDTALTGRGLALVESLAERWAAESAGSGKIVWFELATAEPDVAERRWEVRLLGVPVSSLQEMQQHNQALLRELALIEIDERGRHASLPTRLASLVEGLQERFTDDAATARTRMQEAIERGVPTVDLVWHMPRSFRDHAAELLELLEEADDFCRAGGLLTLAAPTHLAAFRRWYLGEMIAQLDGGAPTPWQDVASEEPAPDEDATVADRTAALLESVLWTAPVGLGFFDTDLRYMLVNDALAEINGIPREAHIGRTVPEVLAEMPSDVPRDLEHVLASGEAVIGREVTAETPARPNERRHWLVSYYPVRTGDGPPFAIGVVVVENTDRMRAEEERAGLLAAEREARAAAEHGERRLAFLAKASTVLAASLDLRATLDHLTALVVPELSDSCSVHLVEAGRLIPVSQAHVEPAKDEVMRELVERREPSRNRLLDHVMSTGESVMIVDVDDDAMRAMADDHAHLEALRSIEIRSGVAVPLVARGRSIGVLSLTMSQASGRRFDERDLAFVEDLAGRAAVAVENSMLYTERSEEARLLQQQLLPQRPPDIPGLEVATRYRAVGEGTQVGGDFYDVFPTGTGRWNVVIGDVCGKGVAAAALTALARHTVRASARHEWAPSQVLRTLNQAILDSDADERFCTIVSLSVVPTAAGARLSLAVGGHPSPYLLGAQGTVRPLGRAGTAIGLFREPQLVDEHDDLGPGDAVVLYTDGVTEARSPDGTFYDTRIEAVLVRSAGLDADGIADALERDVLEFQAGNRRDDMAIVVVRVPPTTARP